MSEHDPNTAPMDGAPTDLSTDDVSALFSRDTSTTDRLRALQAFAGTVRTRLQSVTSVAGQGAEVIAERSGQLLAEVVDRLPIRRAEDLRREFGTDQQAQAGHVIEDAVTLARWLWTAAKAIPAPEPVVHAAKVVLHSAIEIRMVGELLEAHRNPDANAAVTPLPSILATWVGGVPGAPWSTSSVTTVLIAQVHRALKELRGNDSRIKGIMNRGREGGDVVRSLGQRVSDAIRQPAMP